MEHPGDHFGGTMLMGVDYHPHHPILSFSNLLAVYEESDYPIREEDGASWRPFWWYDGTASGWPTGKNDTLGGNEHVIEFKG